MTRKESTKDLISKCIQTQSDNISRVLYTPTDTSKRHPITGLDSKSCVLVAEISNSKALLDTQNQKFLVQKAVVDKVQSHCDLSHSPILTFEFLPSQKRHGQRGKFEEMGKNRSKKWGVWVKCIKFRGTSSPR